MLNNSPYDLAAAVLCLEEAGAVVTDAYGRDLGDRRLLGSGHEFQMSCVAAANRELHFRDLRRGRQRYRAGWFARGRLSAVLQEVSVGQRSIADYTHLVGRALVEEIKELAEPLRGERVLHLSATAMGGGVSEILYALVPLMRDVGLDATGT